jgi:hypothetical protein
MRVSLCLAPDITRKNSKRNAISAASAGAFPPRGAVNFRSANIFNGFFRVPVKKKNPALN